MVPFHLFLTCGSKNIFGLQKVLISSERIQQVLNVHMFGSARLPTHSWEPRRYQNPQVFIPADLGHPDPLNLTGGFSEAMPVSLKMFNLGKKMLRLFLGKTWK